MTDPRGFLAGNPFVAERRPTREVLVGDVGIGGANPIRLQSMTTTFTKDTLATCDQAEQLAAVGCEIVRVTAPSITDAENLRAIRAELDRRGVRVPLAADIHFTPNAALIAALYVEKVRVNPGNYADRKKFEVREYSDAEYSEEIERVAERFRPLVRRCRERGVAMRIGTNHGSLSDRILNRYGDTPLGMVESALEFLDVCEDESYFEIVFSMKASNPRVAIHAYRLLAARLKEREPVGGDYPFHVGVTEAGDGEDGRVKSAIGIGALLEDGLGDTVRVSLTEDPVKEIPVARALAQRSQRRWEEDRGRRDPSGPEARLPLVALGIESPYDHARRPAEPVDLGGLAIGGDRVPAVELAFEAELGELPGWLAALATSAALEPDRPCESILLAATSGTADEALAAARRSLAELGARFPIAVRCEAGAVRALSGEVDRVVVPVVASGRELEEAAAAAIAKGVGLEWTLRGAPGALVESVGAVLDASARAGLREFAIGIESSRLGHAARVVAATLSELRAPAIPLILRHRREPGSVDSDALLDLAVDLGTPLCDGLGDAVSVAGFADPALALDLAYRALQGARLRTTRTEYISCPSCGRTQFDLEETTARVRAKTVHLKGVKIAVMGCIVNGPGEMADADFGYVGAGPGVVNLYVGHEVQERGIPEAEAPERLVGLIRAAGRWQEARS